MGLSIARDDRDAVEADLELDVLDAVRGADVLFLVAFLGRIAGADLARRVGDVRVADAEELAEAGARALVADEVAEFGIAQLEVLSDRVGDWGDGRRAVNVDIADDARRCRCGSGGRGSMSKARWTRPTDHRRRAAGRRKWPPARTVFSR